MILFVFDDHVKKEKKEKRPHIITFIGYIGPFMMWSIITYYNMMRTPIATLCYIFIPYLYIVKHQQYTASTVSGNKMMVW